MSTPDYKLTEPFKYWVNTQDCITFPAGSFVRPIEYAYLPKELKEKFKLNFASGTEAFCHTKIGIICIPKNVLRRVGE